MIDREHDEWLKDQLAHRKHTAAKVHRARKVPQPQDDDDRKKKMIEEEERLKEQQERDRDIF